MKNLLSLDFSSMDEKYRAKLVERLMEHLWFDPNSGCWLWTGWDSGNGYGKISVNGKAMMAHRVVYALEIGPVPENMILDHEVCNTRCCCNPGHLDPCTVQVNTHRGEAVLFGSG